MRFVPLVLLLVSPLFAQEFLAGKSCAARITVPKNWIIRDVNGSPALVPVEFKDKDRPHRKIHLSLSHHPFDRIETSIQSEIDSITAKWPGSSNSRENLIDIIPITTRSGIKGQLARFAQRDKENRYYMTNKFYFKNTSGQIVIACMHVNGKQTVSDQFQKIVTDHLVLD